MKLMKGKFPSVDCWRWPNGQDDPSPMRIRRDEDPHATYLGPDGVIQVPSDDPLLQKRTVPITARRHPRAKKQSDHLTRDGGGTAAQQLPTSESTEPSTRALPWPLPSHSEGRHDCTEALDLAEATLLNRQARCGLAGQRHWRGVA